MHTVMNVWINLTEGDGEKGADQSRLEMTGVYETKVKRNSTQELDSGWQNCFPQRYGLTILKSLHMYIGIQQWKDKQYRYRLAMGKAIMTHVVMD